MNEKTIIQIVSFPRSGSFWVRWCLEVLLQTNIIQEINNKRSFCHALKTHLIHYKINFKNQYILHKSHQPASFSIGKKDNRFVVLVLRNYKECIPRHTGYEFKKELCGQYYTLLNNFDKSKVKKHLIYYEDLIENPKQELQKLIENIDKDYCKNIDRFMEYFEQHKQGSLENYRTTCQFPKTITNGNHVSYHENKLTEEQIKQFDGYFSSKPLYDKYLKRYDIKK